MEDALILFPDPGTKQKKTLSAKYIEQNADSIDWRDAAYDIILDDLTDEFIKKFIHEWDWTSLSARNDLTEDFALKFIDYIDFQELRCQDFSEEFLTKYEERINFDFLIHRNISFSEKFFKKHALILLSSLISIEVKFLSFNPLGTEIIDKLKFKLPEFLLFHNVKFESIDVIQFQKGTTAKFTIRIPPFPEINLEMYSTI